MDRFQYALVLLSCLAVTLPLELLGARVYRRPALLLSTLSPVAGVFVVWDLVAVWEGIWTFNPRYVAGWLAPFPLPLEELLFFLVIPVCGLLTYETVDRVLRLRRARQTARHDPTRRR